MNESIPDALDVVSGHHVRNGSYRVDDLLGIQKMPFGYALMLDADGLYFYWLRYDGLEGAQTWNKWAAYRGAKWNFDNMTAPIHKPMIVTTGNS